MRWLLIATLLIGVLAACSDAEEGSTSSDTDAINTQVAAGIAATMAAQPTATSTPLPPTATIPPTVTPTLEPTATPTVTPSPTPMACSAVSGEFIFDLMQDYVDEWTDAFNLTLSTQRIALSAQIANLQNIRQRLSRENWPACGQVAQSELAAAMDASIDGFIAFLGRASDSVVAGHFNRAADHLDNVIEEIKKLQPDLDRRHN